jgi:hypothetical protein
MGDSCGHTCPDCGLVWTHDQCFIRTEEKDKAPCPDEGKVTSGIWPDGTWSYLEDELVVFVVRTRREHERKQRQSKRGNLPRKNKATV